MVVAGKLVKKHIDQLWIVKDNVQGVDEGNEKESMWSDDDEIVNSELCNPDISVSETVPNVENENS